VTLQLKGAPPREFGGVNHAARHGHKLTRSGFSTVYSGVFTVPRRAEYGFALHNAKEQTIFELGYNPRVAQGKFDERYVYDGGARGRRGVSQSSAS
jgi:hypothetical protein